MDLNFPNPEITPYFHGSDVLLCYLNTDHKEWVASLDDEAKNNLQELTGKLERDEAPVQVVQITSPDECI